MRKLLLGLLLVLAAGAAVALLQYRALVTFTRTPHAVERDVVVAIASGTGPRAVCEKLFAAGAITDERRFYWSVRYLQRAAGRLKSGEYLFKAGVNQTPEEIVERLLRGEVLNLKVTIPEGLRLEEQAPLVAAAGIGDAAEYVRLARDPAFTKTLGIPADSLEGYLFPDTYLVPRTTSTAGMLKLMVEHFDKAFAAAQAQRLPSVTLTARQAVTLASIIEKETGQAAERPRISCVFHNRLRKEMKLQTDPTVMYAAFLATGRWDENIHRSDLERVHPYNTYAVKGLPPGPICNAGEAALAAALHPITCNDLFFVSKNDTTHVFCPDLACHEANVEKWQREYFRQKRAGGSGH